MYGRFIDFFINNRQMLDALVFDIDGTLSCGGKSIPEAVNLISFLRQEKFPFFLLTNDANTSHTDKAQIVASSGIPVLPEEIISSGDALAQYIVDHDLAGHKFYQCGEMGNPGYAEQAGAVIVRDWREAGDCEGLIIGEGVYDWRKEVTGAFNLLMKNPLLPVLVGNPDSFWPFRHGLGIGAGAMARFLGTLIKESGYDLNIIYTGKPYAPVYELVKRRLCDLLPDPQHLDMSRVAMIGDSLASDITGGNRAGMFTCLVLTGITSGERARSVSGEQQPDKIFTAL